MPSSKSKRDTVYFDPDLHKALRPKAAATERSLSDVIDEAVRVLLAERRSEPSVSFESFVPELKQGGAL